MGGKGREEGGREERINLINFIYLNCEERKNKIKTNVNNLTKN